jgi:hypothetical protein
MKTALFAFAIVLAAISTTQADPNDKWEYDGRNCHARISLDALDQGWGGKVAVKLADVLQLQKMIRALKKCEAFSQCVNDRFEGKVKHCYINDPRWKGADGPLEGHTQPPCGIRECE